MMKKWHILYCDASMRMCPITDFIESRPQKHQAKIIRFLALLEEMGPTLTRPYADLLRDSIHELRLKLSGNQARILYFFCFETYIILYQAFWKNTDRVPEKRIIQTIRYRDQFLASTSKKQLSGTIDGTV
jgi:hypothetical protein